MKSTAQACGLVPRGGGEEDTFGAVLDRGRAYLAQTVGDGFANRTLATPQAVTDEISRRDSMRGAEKWRQAAGTTYQIDKVIVMAETPAEALEKAKRYARLRAMNGRNVNPNLRPVS